MKDRKYKTGYRLNKKYKIHYSLFNVVAIVMVLAGITVREEIKAYASMDFSGYTYNVEEGVDDHMEFMDTRFLKADDKVIRDHAGTGEVVQLRGTNVGGWQLMEAWMCPTNAPDQKTMIATLNERFGAEKAEELIQVYENAWWQEQDFDHVKDMNFNVLRLPISYLNLLDDEGKLREDTLSTYDWFVKECSERDIYVILDLHAAPGSQNGKDHSGDTSGSVLFTDEAAQELTISLWVQLAAHYKGNAAIAGYDLLNEPEGSEDERSPWGVVQLPLFNRIYQAIREVDPDHMIIFNAVWDPVNMPDPSVYGWENVIYEYHFYGWDGIDNVAAQKRFIDSKVVNNNRAGHNVPVLVGEFTMFDKLPSWEHALRIFNEQGWSWTTWTYKTVEMGSWGIFNSRRMDTPKVDIYNDSADVIEEKWSKTSTVESFTRNKHLHDLLRVMADRHGTDPLPEETLRQIQELTTDKSVVKDVKDVPENHGKKTEESANASKANRSMLPGIFIVAITLIVLGCISFYKVKVRNKKLK